MASSSRFVRWVMLGLMVLTMAGSASSDIQQDRNECADQLLGLATCLEYVGGDSKAPPLDCCTGLKQVLQKSKKCLCILVKDRNDPSLGLKINATRALGLPTVCHAPANVSECPALLHLAPNSPEAKVFEDYANSAKGSESTPAAANVKGNSTNTGSSSSELKTDGRRRKRWLAVDMAGLLIISLLLPNYI